HAMSPLALYYCLWHQQNFPIHLKWNYFQGWADYQNKSVFSHLPHFLKPYQNPQDFQEHLSFLPLHIASLKSPPKYMHPFEKNESYAFFSTKFYWQLSWQHSHL